MQRRLGQAGRLDQGLQRKKLIFRGDDLEQREEPQRWRVAVERGEFGLRRSDDLHDVVIISPFRYFVQEVPFSKVLFDLAQAPAYHPGTVPTIRKPEPAVAEPPPSPRGTNMNRDPIPAAPETRQVVKGVQKMTPSEAFVETMVANGVTDIFGIMGSAFMDAMDIFAPAGIRLVPVVHEQGAAHMADGYARVSGRHGVVIGQNGPGISNCVTAIAAAYWAHSPVVIVTPETGTMGMGLGGFQEANQLPMFQEFTKYQGHVNNPKRMAEYTARCFDRAISEMGPTQLNIPRDYFYGEITVEIPTPMRVERGAGGENSLDQAAQLLAKAKFPVILAGGGVVMGDAVEECKALAER